MAYSPAAAINKARELGFANVSLTTQRQVTIHQSWTTAGKEFAIFKLARGRDKGMTVGNAYQAMIATDYAMEILEWHTA